MVHATLDQVYGCVWFVKHTCSKINGQIVSKAKEKHACTFYFGFAKWIFETVHGGQMEFLNHGGQMAVV